MATSYANYEWFLKTDLSRYSGKWLAIVDNEVVASGSDVNKIIEETKKKYPTKKPLITKIRNKLSIL
jgi:dihydroxyacetone kinase-like predicted kinase